MAELSDYRYTTLVILHYTLFMETLNAKRDKRNMAHYVVRGWANDYLQFISCMVALQQTEFALACFPIEVCELDSKGQCCCSFNLFLLYRLIPRKTTYSFSMTIYNTSIRSTRFQHFILGRFGSLSVRLFVCLSICVVAMDVASSGGA